MKHIRLLVFSALGLTGVMQAAVLTTASSTGLGTVGITPLYTLRFDGTAGLVANSLITNQYAFAGVSFSSPAFYDGNAGAGGCGFSNMTGDCVANFASSNGQLVSGPTAPFSILFTAPQTYAAFSLVTDGGGQNNTTITAYRNGSIVDQATLTTSTNIPADFFGFYGESTPFDRITVANTGMNFIVIDNLQVSAVPEPATVGMLALGLGSVAAFARRRRKA